MHVSCYISSNSHSNAYTQVLHIKTAFEAVLQQQQPLQLYFLSVDIRASILQGYHVFKGLAGW